MKNHAGNLALSARDQARLDGLYKQLLESQKRFIGYPCNCCFDYTELYRFLGCVVNNVGDPFAGSAKYFNQNTYAIEREVIDYFGRLTHAPDNGFWGYVTSGGTEGNMYGLYLARELYPEGMVYFSEDTHYSVTKMMRVLHARNIMIKSQPNGEMDYEDLRETIRIHRDVTPVIFANIGTTMKGAVDDVGKVRKIMEDLAIPQFYIHGDAALSGMILPFVSDPQPFHFGDGVDSLSISGHKFIGSPIPCGVALALGKNVDRIARSVEYIGALDTTILGSRNGISPLIFWYAFRKYGEKGFKRMVAQCLEVADYAVAQLVAHGIDAWRNKNSITVVFPRPSDEILRKWQVAPFRDIAHIITMPHVQKATIDCFIQDLLKDHSQSVKTPSKITSKS